MNEMNLDCSSSIYEATLTNDLRKFELYSWDPYFRDCVDDLQGYSSDEKKKLSHGHVPLILRPDALLTGQYKTVLDLVRSAGFEFISAKLFKFDRFRIRECWKYQMNTATRERLDVFDMMLIEMPAIYLLLRHLANDGRSASERLNDIKGSSDPAKRKPGDLRYSEENIQLSVFTYIHIPDEPIDFLRELGAFYGREERMALIESALHGDPIDPSSEIEEVARKIGKHTLRAEDAWISILRSSISTATKEVNHSFHENWSANPRQWRTTIRDIYQNNAETNHWDIVAISAASALTHDPSREPVISPKYTHSN